jgi:hypothetical protein
MHFTIINLLGAAAPFILAATLWGIWKESRSRSLMLRMVPPERRVREKSDKHARHSLQLWTAQNCQMELLTEGTMHAFEANAKAYIPDRMASNYAPGRVRQRVALYRAEVDRTDETSILLRTLERSADMLSASAAAIYGKPEIDESSADTVLSYIDSVQPVRIQEAA